MKPARAVILSPLHLDSSHSSFELLLSDEVEAPVPVKYPFLSRSQVECSCICLCSEKMARSDIDSITLSIFHCHNWAGVVIPMLVCNEM